RVLSKVRSQEDKVIKVEHDGHGEVISMQTESGNYIAWGYMSKNCQIFPGTQVLIQSQKLDKASELVKGKEPPGYGLTLYNRQDPWLKARFPLAIRPEDLPANNLVWKNGSEMQALGQGADQIRLYHPTIVIWDEMAFIEEAS